MQSIDDQADIAVPCEPFGVVLISRFVAVADVILLYACVAAYVKNRRGGSFEVFGNIQVPRDVEARSRLKVDILDGELLVLDPAGNDRF